MRRMLLLVLLAGPAQAEVLTGMAAQGDWRGDAPGVVRRIEAGRLPAGGRSSANQASVVPGPAGARLAVPPGFAVRLFASGLRNPRVLRVAPGGDVFVAETAAGRVRVLRAGDGEGQPAQADIFADGLDRPFGIAFHPPGPAPRFVYVATNNAVLRFGYRAGQMRAEGAGEVVVPRLSDTYGHHTTRDLAFSADGARMYVSVGSGTDHAEGMPPLDAAARAAHDAQFGMGSAWGDEEQRGDVLVFDPEGGGRRVFATGLRNCVTLAVPPGGGAPWCATNERDGLGDDLPPDYVTQVHEGGFYGWPWFYLGGHADPRWSGARPELAGRVTVPDVLLQAHSAALGMVFYDGQGPAAFPPRYRGDAFVALHGSWNRSKRTGYKVVRLAFTNGVADGTYEDFLTGFVVDDGQVWGRPVGVAVAHDGALLVSEDGNGTIWRVAPSP